MPLGADNRLSDKLSKLQQAVDDMCKTVANLIGNGEGIDVQKLVKALDSLYTRARQAPQLAASWGFRPFLAFDAAKAAETAEESPDCFKTVIRGMQLSGSDGNTSSSKASKDSISCNSSSNKNLDPTSLGYLLYVATLLRYLCGDNRSGNPQEKEVFKVFKDYISSIIKGEKDKCSVGEAEARFAVETLARLITINVAPVLGEASEIEKKIRDKKERANKLKELIKSLCSVSSEEDPP